jgi:hypothetical protein
MPGSAAATVKAAASGTAAVFGAYGQIYVIGGRSTPLNAGEDFLRQVTGTNGNCTIPSTATAISYNLTVPNSTATGFFTVYPADAATRPNSSSINPVGGEGIKANGGIVALSATGAINVFTLTGPLANLSSRPGR